MSSRHCTPSSPLLLCNYFRSNWHIRIRNRVGDSASVVVAKPGCGGDRCNSNCNFSDCCLLLAAEHSDYGQQPHHDPSSNNSIYGTALCNGGRHNVRSTGHCKATKISNNRLSTSVVPKHPVPTLLRLPAMHSPTSRQRQLQRSPAHACGGAA